MKPIVRCLGVGLAAVSLTVLTMTTASAADGDNGGRLAQRWCATCHVVAPSQQSANADAPPFESIAKMPGFSPEKLSYFLLEPHPKMPNMALSRREAEDLSAYIARLGK